MLIQFSVSNFLSFDDKETFSMMAGKARKNIERIFNYKYPYEYNSRYDAIAERKDQVKEFYGKLRWEVAKWHTEL